MRQEALNTGAKKSVGELTGVESGMLPLSELPRVQVVTCSGPFGTSFSKIESIMRSTPILLSPNKGYIFQIKDDCLNVSPEAGELGPVEMSGLESARVTRIQRITQDHTRYSFENGEGKFSIDLHEKPVTAIGMAISRTTSPYASSSASSRSSSIGESARSSYRGESSRSSNSGESARCGSRGER